MGRGRNVAVVAAVGVLLAGAVVLASGGLGVRTLFDHGDSAAGRGEAARQVDVVRSPLRFDVPPGWHQVTRTQDPKQDWVVQAARQQGFTPDEYVELLRDSTLATVEGPAAGGRAQSINVQDSGYPTLPSTTTVEAGLETLHEEVVGSRVVATPVGTAIVTRYRTRLGAETITGDSIHVAVAGQVLRITVGAAREGAVTPVTDQVLRTLHTD